MIVGQDLHPCGDVHQGPDPHDEAQDGVGGEQVVLGVGTETMVGLVAQRCPVLGGGAGVGGNVDDGVVSHNFGIRRVRQIQLQRVPGSSV